MPTIFLIEDNKICRIAQERQLIKAGYSVIHSDDGDNVVRMATAEHPDVVILDMMLPKLSGEEVLRRLKTDPITTNIPVIVVTALSQKNERKLRHDGAAAFIEKSWLLEAPDKLLLAVEQVLHKAESAVRQQFDAQTTAYANAAN